MLCCFNCTGSHKSNSDCNYLRLSASLLSCAAPLNLLYLSLPALLQLLAVHLPVVLFNVPSTPPFLARTVTGFGTLDFGCCATIVGFGVGFGGGFNDGVDGFGGCATVGFGLLEPAGPNVAFRVASIPLSICVLAVLGIVALAVPPPNPAAFCRNLPPPANLVAPPKRRPRGSAPSASHPACLYLPFDKLCSALYALYAVYAFPAPPRSAAPSARGAISSSLTKCSLLNCL